MSCNFFTLQAAGKLKITDKGVLSSLLRLASDDNSWKVKAHTIKGELSNTSTRLSLDSSLISGQVRWLSKKTVFIRMQVKLVSIGMVLHQASL